ncbi:MAG: DeoR family transcriptional regulator, partial [Bryobacteraceae bacterium]
MRGAPKSSARQDQVLGLLRECTSASIPDMAKQFGVSEMTVRRDLERLAESGQVIRTPGGARLARSFSFEKTFTERLRKMAAAKDRIGRAAGALVKEG